MALACPPSGADERDSVASLSVRTSVYGIHVEDVDGWPGWAFVVRPTRDGGVHSVEAIAPPGHPMTFEEFRRVPYRLLRRLCGQSTSLAQAMALVPNPDRYKARPYSRAHLDVVVMLYRYAVSQTVPANALIADVFEVSEKTVQRWLRRARILGLLDSATAEKSAAPLRVDDRVGEHIA
jgi:hypothetical protein